MTVYLFHSRNLSRYLKKFLSQFLQRKQSEILHSCFYQRLALNNKKSDICRCDSKICEFIYFVMFIFIKGSPLSICNIPEKQLHERRKNLEMYAIVKLGFSPHYDGFEANFKSIV